MAAQTDTVRQFSSVNIAHYLPSLAARFPDKLAIIDSQVKDKSHPARQITFGELEQRTNRIANGLVKAGISRGARTMVMVRPSIDFIAISFALFKIGAVPLLIDPGMGRKNFIHAVESVRPEAFIGIELAHVLRLLHRKSFRSVQTVITVGARWFWGGSKLAKLEVEANDGFEMADTSSEETAAILFTTGSTGPAKGVVYTHGIFDTQTQLIHKEWNIGEEDVDLPVFPLFALFSTALGAKVIIPDMNPTRPAFADADKMVRIIEEHQVTYSFGSPAFWTRVSDFCVEKEKVLKSLHTVLMAGAPISPALVQRMSKIMEENADVGIPYGATESLPVSWISGRKVRAETGVKTVDGQGYCVGRPLTCNTVKIIQVIDEAIPEFAQANELPPTEVGEICVKGPVVTKAYFARDEATALAKMRDGDQVWHRMGDLGYFDEDGLLWFCGRKAHRVDTANNRLYSVCTEAIFNRHEQVKRSALVGVTEGETQKPVIVIECLSNKMTEAQQDTLRKELLELGQTSHLSKSIDDILFHPSFPVDIRHNAKIFREKLAVWAQERTGQS
ncbi:MAG: fatty acid CoA ligase family protein [Myxococcota bacterium]|nr:fatty acid CoA ligase family protein [Myxococcota bacterium]